MFGEKLKQARLNAGLSQQQLGETINTDKRMISKIENGFCLPTLKDLLIICDKLKTTPQELQFPVVATQKIKVATAIPRKSSIDTYKFSVRLPKSDFAELNKSNLKRCGYNSLNDFMKMAYKQLLNELANIDANKK